METGTGGRSHAHQRTLLILGVIGLLLGLVMVGLMIAEPVWYGWLIALVLLGSGVGRLVQYRQARRVTDH
jgi:uncharacterized membrane protein HdeD (DUF308 family)